MKLKKMITCVTLSLIAISCRQEFDCKGFDVNESIMDWYIVPNLQQDVTYIDSNAVEYTFSQTSFAKSEDYTFKCGGFTKCACDGSYLNSSYANSDLGVIFKSNVSHAPYSKIDFTYDTIPYGLNIDMNDNLYQEGDTSLTVTAIDTFAIFNTYYTNVYELTSTIEDFKFWLKKDVGMVAFEFNNTTYKLN